MRITQLLSESKKIEEAPMGFLGKMGNKVMSKIGNDKATGRLTTGNLANQLHSEFQQYLGSSGLPPTAKTVLDWLASKGYPTAKAKGVIKNAGNANSAPQGPMSKIKQAAGNLKGKMANIGNQPDVAQDLSQAVSEAVAAELSKQVIDQVFIAAAQEAVQVKQQQRQQKQGIGAKKSASPKLSAMNGGKSAGGQPADASNEIAALNQRIARIEKKVGL